MRPLSVFSKCGWNGFWKTFSSTLPYNFPNDWTLSLQLYSLLTSIRVLSLSSFWMLSYSPPNLHDLLMSIMFHFHNSAPLSFIFTSRVQIVTDGHNHKIEVVSFVLSNRQSVPSQFFSKVIGVDESWSLICGLLRRCLHEQLSQQRLEASKNQDCKSWVLFWMFIFKCAFHLTIVEVASFGTEAHYSSPLVWSLIGLTRNKPDLGCAFLAPVSCWRSHKGLLTATHH